MRPRRALQELEARLRQAAAPGRQDHSHVTRGEHARLLEQAVAAREEQVSAEAEAEAGRQARRAAWALQEREAELAASHRQALHQVPRGYNKLNLKHALGQI